MFINYFTHQQFLGLKELGFVLDTIIQMDLLHVADAAIYLMYFPVIPFWQELKNFSKDPCLYGISLALR